MVAKNRSAAATAVQDAPAQNGHDAQAADTHRTPAVKKEPTQDEPDPNANGAAEPVKNEEATPILNGTVTKDYPNGMTEEQLLSVANEIRPVLNLNHHDYLLKEMRWLAVDVAQERLWKMTTARQVAYMAAAVGRTRLTQQLDKITPKSAREAAKAATLPSYTKDDQAAAEKALEACCFYPTTPDLPLLMDDVMRAQEEEETIAFELAQREYRADLAAAKVAAQPPPDLLDDEAGASLPRFPSLGAFFEEEDYSKRRRPSLVDTKRSGVGSRRKMFSLDDGMDDEPMSARDRKRGRLDDDEEFVIDGMRPKSRRLRDQAMGVRRPSDRNLVSMDRSAMNKRLKAVRSPMGKLDGNQQYTGMSGFLRNRSAMPPAQLVDWSREEELLLCAVVFEFGANWLLISDIITSSDSVQGTCRRPEACKHKFKQLGDPNFQGEPSNDQILEYNNITKNYAREIMAKNLPTPDVPLRKALDATAAAGTALHLRRRQEEASSQDTRTVRQVAHPSLVAIETKLLQQMGGTPWSPAEVLALMERNEAAAQSAAAAARPPGAPSPGPGGGEGGHTPLTGQPSASPQQRRNLSFTQLQQILASGRLPSGQPLTPEMRQSLLQKQAQIQAQMQRQVSAGGMAGAQYASGMPAMASQPMMSQPPLGGAMQPMSMQSMQPMGMGMQPGMPPMQAMQPMGMGMQPNMPPPMGATPMQAGMAGMRPQMQPGMPSMGMPPMQPGAPQGMPSMGMPPIMPPPPGP